MPAARLRCTHNLETLYSAGEKELEDFVASQQSAQERTASEELIAQLYQAEKTGLLKLGKHGQGRPDTLNLGQLTNVLPVSHSAHSTLQPAHSMLQPAQGVFQTLR